MKLCEDVDMAPAQHLVPAIQLSLYAPALSMPAAKKGLADSGTAVAAALAAPGAMAAVKDEATAASEAHLVPEDLSLQVRGNTRC